MQRERMGDYTAVFQLEEGGCRGKLAEWPQVTTFGQDLDDCRFQLKLAMHEAVVTLRQQGKRPPEGPYAEKKKKFWKLFR